MQFQPALRSVAGVLESALHAVFREECKLTVAGRTDTGVHASGQVVSLRTSRESFPFERLDLALNALLPGDLSVREVAVVPDDFSARFCAIERRYLYALLVRRAPNALLANYAAHVRRGFDRDAFLAGAAHLLGTHDFRSFCGTPPERGGTLRTLHAVDVQIFGDLVRVELRADGFLHRMVRTIVGTLLACADGRRDPASMAQVLEARDRRAAGLTAAAGGLYLAGVRYRDGYDSYAQPPLFALRP